MKRNGIEMEAKEEGSIGQRDEEGRGQKEGQKWERREEKI